jgi:SAM-dependent methyltransferase
MVTTEDIERFARERREADRRYNDALSALDHAIVASAGGGDSDRIAAALIVFLQRITAFVETKDRELDAVAADRLAKLQPALDAVAELRAQMTLVQRATQMLTRNQSPVTNHQPPVTDHQSPVTNRPAVSPREAVAYLAFEDQFRGSDEAIAARLRVYLPIFAGAADVVDLGCGRGEFLATLKSAGVPARGVDLNREMVAAARERGLDVVELDALGFLASAADGSLGGIFAAQVVEHLEPAYLMRLLDTAYDKLRPGAPIVIETINAACWLAFFSSYIRDFTHVRPIHPETLQYLLRASGFERVTIQYSEPVPEQVKMQAAHLPAEILESADPVARAVSTMAHALNANAAVLNNLLFTHLDFAAIGYKT